MKQIELKQGSQEWLAHRANHFNASDAPAMMGVSSYKTRNQLMHELHTGLPEEVNAETQKRFDDGHKFEAIARPLAEQIIGEELYPVVGVNGKFSASFDGITLDDGTIWEHKTLNERLDKAFSAFTELHLDGGAYHPSFHPKHRIPNPLPEEYCVQMEHQLMVSGASRCLFTASKCEPDEHGELVVKKALHCWYESDDVLRCRIISGWNQFGIDLGNYKPTESIIQPIGRTPENLPALHIEVSGKVNASNLKEFKDHAFAIFDGFKKSLETDQDFADAENTIKWCKSVETKLSAAKDNAQGQMGTIDELFRTIDEISAGARKQRLEYEKLVEAKKQQIREEIVMAGRREYSEYERQLNTQIAPCLIPISMPDFAGAIKGKRTIESIKNAVDTALANQKIHADSALNRIKANLDLVRSAGNDSLFADIATLCLKDSDFVSLTVDQRLKDYSEKQAIAVQAAISEKEQQQVNEQKPNAAIAVNDVKPVQSTKKDDGKRITIGDICRRIGISMTSDFVATLGISPVEVNRASKLYTEQQFMQICASLVKHISSVQKQYE